MKVHSSTRQPHSYRTFTKGRHGECSTGYESSSLHGCGRGERAGFSVEDYLRIVAQGISWLAEAAGITIVAVAVVRAAWSYAVELVRRMGPLPSTRIRLALGRSLALGLEFLVAADIVMTAVAPTWEDIGKLAAIAAIRTGLNFFLDLELQRERKEVESAGVPQPRSE